MNRSFRATCRESLQRVRNGPHFRRLEMLPPARRGDSSRRETPEVVAPHPGASVGLLLVRPLGGWVPLVQCAGRSESGLWSLRPGPAHAPACWPSTVSRSNIRSGTETGGMPASRRHTSRMVGGHTSTGRSRRARPVETLRFSRARMRWAPMRVLPEPVASAISTLPEFSSTHIACPIPWICAGQSARPQLVFWGSINRLDQSPSSNSDAARANASFHPTTLSRCSIRARSCALWSSPSSQIASPRAQASSTN